MTPKQRNAQRRKLYGYFKKQGYSAKEARAMRSPIKALHRYRIVKQSAIEKRKKFPGIRIPRPPISLTKKQALVLQRRVKTYRLTSPVMDAWKTLSPEERLYRQENMRRFYAKVAESTGKSIKEVIAEFMKVAGRIATESQFYDTLQEMYTRIVGIKM